jgi:hypothetical protein
MAGRDNTTRIELLESRAETAAGRLDVIDIQLKWITDTLNKAVTTHEGHSAKITVIEKDIVVLADFKSCQAAVAAMEKDLIVIRKDLESLSKWKEEQKKEKDEWSRRKWAFGPNIVGALISAVISAIVSFTIFRLSRP